MGLIRRRAARVAAIGLLAAAAPACGDSTAADQQPLPPAYPVAKTSPAEAATTAQAEAPATTTTTPATTTTDATAGRSPSRPAPPKDILSPADKASFATLQRSLGAPIGLAVSGAGLGQRVQVAGTLRDAVAWSTSKVPVAMAVLAAGLGDAQASSLRAAITASDNAAAERLWTALGGGQTAAQAVDAQLRAAGDLRTVTESQRLRAGFTPFGQTDWKLSDQVRFTAGMACSDAGRQVLALMSETVSAQRWGLGAVGLDAQMKGGWGPGVRPGVGSGYLDRQMGVVVLGGKPLVVSMAALPGDGQHTSGTAQLTRIAKWLVAHADVRRLPTRPRCG